MISQKYLDEIAELYDAELTAKEIARKLKIAGRTARRYLRLLRQQRGEGRIPIKIPKILVFDIETVMMEVFVWGLYKQRIPPQNMIKDWNTVAWAAKWLFEHKVMSDVQTPEEAIRRDDKRILKGMWKLLNEADIVIAHNGDKFDIRKLNARFIEQGFLPPMPYRSIDTLKACKRNFAFSSYALDFLCQKFGIGNKVHAGYDLWKECLKGNKEALSKMNKYNIKDVLLLEEFYVKIRPWIKSHPGVGLYMDVEEPVCDYCGSADLNFTGSYYTTQVNKFKAFRCKNCGAVGRARKSEIDVEPVNTGIISVAR